MPGSSGALPLAAAAASATMPGSGLSTSPGSAGPHKISPADYADAPIVKFAADVLGLNLWPGQAAVLGYIYAAGVRVAVLRLGRRSGKDTMASVAAVWEATVNADAHLAAVQPGEQVAIVVIAQSQRNARWTHRMIGRLLGRAEANLGKRLLAKPPTLDEIELTNGIVILTMPCFAPALRGPAVAVGICTEIGHWAGIDGSPLDAKEVVDAISPAIAQFPEGRLFLLSTPKLAHGYFHEIVRRAEGGRQFPRLAAFHATTRQMNPTLPASFFEAERAADPIVFAREYEAEFMAAISAVLDSELVLAAVADRRDLAPQPGVRFLIALDPAWTGDTFTAIVGHREHSGRVVVDAVRGWRGSRAQPVLIEPTLDEIAGLATIYNRSSVITDQGTAQPILQGLRRRGISVREQPWTADSKVEAASAVRQALYAGNLELPYHRELVAELLSLEQRPLPSGKPRIAAPGRQHDDYATALMALVSDLARRRGDVPVIGLRGELTYKPREEYEAEKRVELMADMTLAERRDWRARELMDEADQMSGGIV
jgi:hypothetical protein